MPTGKPWRTRAALIPLLVATLHAQAPQELMQAANEAMQRRDYATAEKHFSSLVKQLPQVAELHSNLGLALLAQQHFEGAEESFRQALRLKPELFAPNFFLGRILFQQSRYEEALPLLRAAVKAQPGEAMVRRLVAATLVGLERYEEAVAEYRTLLDRDPEDVETLYGLGKVYLHLGQRTFDRLQHHEDSAFFLLANAEFQAQRPRFEEVAEDFYRRAIAAAPDHAGLRTALGMFLLRQQDWAGAREAFEQALVRDPFAYRALFGRAFARIGAGELEDALQDLERAAAIRPEFFQPLPEPPVESLTVKQVGLEPGGPSGGFAAAYLRAALSGDPALLAAAEGALPKAESFAGDLEEMLRRKRYEGVIPRLAPRSDQLPVQQRIVLMRALLEVRQYRTLAILDAGDHPEEIYLQGTAYHRLGREMLERLAAADPDSARAHQLLGDSFYARELYTDAAAEYQEAVKTRPDDPELLYALGSTWLKIPDYPRATATYRRLLQLQPLHAEAAYNLGVSLAAQNQHQEAIEPLRRAIELNPDLKQAHVALGRVFSALEKPREALPHLELGADTDTDGTVHYQLFQIYRELGRHQEAAEARKQSLALRRQAADREAAK